MRSHFTPSRVAIIEKTINQKKKKFWRGCGEIRILIHRWRIVKMLQATWKTVWQFLRQLNIELTIWNSNSSPRYQPIYNSYMNIHGSVIHNSPFISWWMDNQTVLCLYSGVRVSHKKNKVLTCRIRVMNLKNVTFGYSVFVWKYGNSSRDGWWWWLRSNALNVTKLYT